MEISRKIRRNILDGLRIDEVNWSGKLDEVSFLERLYNLKSLPSNDIRFDSAAGDIWQHRINNYDWDDFWIFEDPRFDLLNCPHEQFIEFLCEIVHPIVRPDRAEAEKLVGDFNEQLRLAGFQLYEVEKIAGRPRYESSQVNEVVPISVDRAKYVADVLDASWMQKEIRRLEESVESDPDLAIGTSKELIESCCKTLLRKMEIEISSKDDLPKLTKKLTKALDLVPEGIPDEAKGAEKIRLILRNLSALTGYIAELRGLYGTGHGRDGNHRGLQARHARLAVGAASTFIDFVSATYQKKHNES